VRLGDSDLSKLSDIAWARRSNCSEVLRELMYELFESEDAKETND
jgi:hypothetical protein